MATTQVQFHIKQYGLEGSGSNVYIGYQLILRVLTPNEAMVKNIWLKDFVTAVNATDLAAAKASAVLLFATAAGPGADAFSNDDFTDTPVSGSPHYVESLSDILTVTF